MKDLSGTQRKYLRGLSHGLAPIVQVGKGGVSEALAARVDAALEEHELIKVRFLEFKKDRKPLSAELARRTRSHLAGVIGNVAVLYREAREPERRRVTLPDAR
jgi:RNA-binding protein